MAEAKFPPIEGLWEVIKKDGHLKKGCERYKAWLGKQGEKQQENYRIKELQN